METILSDEELIGQVELLLPEIGKRINAVIANHPLAKGRTQPQIKVLGHLYRRGQCTVSDVAHALGISLPAASETIDKLVEEGMLTRHANPADRRQVLVELTAPAKKLGDEIHCARRAQLRAALELLEPHERPYFARSLEVLAAALKLGPDELDVCRERLVRDKG